MPREAKSYGIRDMYRIFKEDNPKLDISYDLFKEIINEHNKKATATILEGGSYNFGRTVGSIYIKRIKRRFRIDADGKIQGAMIDHNETRKLKAMGHNKVVYHTSPYYFRWAWYRKGNNIQGHSAYCFQPTKGINGTKSQLKRLLQDPINHGRFRNEHYK